MSQLRGVILQHGGIEHTEVPIGEGGATASLEASLLLRLVLREESRGRHDQSLELHFPGRWALLLASLEPGDVITVAGASPQGGDEGCWHVRRGSTDCVVSIRRGDEFAVINSEAVEAGDVPDWLKLPATRAVRGGQYKYSNYLCTLRDGIEANLFAVVFENAKPGPTQFSRGVGTNVLVIDKSQGNLPCSAWASSPDLPQYSMQISMSNTSPEHLPFLCVGDVIRCHRVRIAARPPRYLNIRQQKYSAVIVFPISLGAMGTAADLEIQRLTPGEPSVNDVDRERVLALQSWVRGRLSTETVSSYLVYADELQRSNGNRDLAVKVVRVLAGEQVLVVADGSTDEPLRVQAAGPPDAANWLFQHVQVGMWLKMRNVSPGDECDLTVSAAQVTRLPPWCFDVRARAAKIGIADPVDESVGDSPHPEAEAVAPEPLQPGADAMAQELEEERRTGIGTGFADTEVETELDERHTEVVEAPALQPGALPDGALPIRRPAALDSRMLSSPLVLAQARELPAGLQAQGSPARAGPRIAQLPAHPSPCLRAPEWPAPPVILSAGASSSTTPLAAAPAVTWSGGAISSATPFAALGALAPGDRVVLFGMNKHPNLNDKQGTLLELYREEGSRQRWLVRVDGNPQPLAVRTSNLRHAPLPAVSHAAVGEQSRPADITTTLGATNVAVSDQPQLSESTSHQARLATIYGSHSTVRITELPAALAAGHRSLVLGGFRVERVLTGAGQKLLRARCRICGASFAWEGGAEREAKRRRQTLPCGHWLFDLAFEFELELRDAVQGSSAAQVAIREQQDTLFGITPQTAATNPAELNRAQEMLASLLAFEGHTNTITVLVSSYPSDTLVACDAGIVPLGE